MKKKFSYQEMKLRAAAYCSTSEHCAYDIKKKLTEWGANEQESAQIIDYLQEENFLNEQRFVQAFVKDKVRFSKWGKIKIAFELKMKKINEQEISRTMEQIDEEVYTNILSELLEKKDKSIKYSSQNDRKSKLFRFAQSRGFESSLAIKIIDRITK